MESKKPNFLNVTLSADLVEKLYQAVLSSFSEKGMSPEIESLDAIADTLPASRNLSSAQNSQLNKIRLLIKDLLITDLEKALLELRAVLVPNSLSYDSIILLTAKFHRITKSHHNGQIDFQTAELEFAKIENAVIFMVNHLEESEVNPKSTH